MIRIRFLSCALLLFFLFPAPGNAQVDFTDVTGEVGLDGVGGVNFSWADYDGDGDPDILVNCNRLFRNDGGVFTEVTSEAGLSGGHGIWADIDNDGDLDLYCPGRGQAVRLFENNGNGTFSDISDFDADGTRDMTADRPILAGAWGDYDLDGFVDMYVIAYERTGNADCDLDLLWKNDGDKTFTDVSAVSGIEAGESAITNADPGMCGRGVTWGDYNNDGWLDIHVSDYRLDQNMLFENKGDGTFDEVAKARGIDGHEDSGSWGHSLGADFCDMDNDGDLDIYTSNLAHWWGASGFGHDISYLWRNEGAAGGFSFTDVRAASGIHPYTADPFDDTNDFEEGAPGWADWDNDTVPDLYVTEFYPFKDHWGRLYRGLGGGTFEDRSDPGNGDCGSEPDPINFTVGPTCLKRWYSWNAAWADFDGDGDVDLLVSGNPRFNQCDVVPMPAECGAADPANRDTWPQPSSIWLFRNEVGRQNNWLHLRVVGTNGNRAGIGARVTAEVGGISMMREVSGGHGYHSAQHDLPVEFGLGAAESVDTLTIRWQAPGFPTTTLLDVAANQRIVAYETAEEIRRGSAPDALAAYDTSEFFPWLDPEAVLDPSSGSHYYRLSDSTARIHMRKDQASQSIRLIIEN